MRYHSYCAGAAAATGGAWLSYFGTTVPEAIAKGILYIVIAAIFIILLIGLNRIKPKRKRKKKQKK